MKEFYEFVYLYVRMCVVHTLCVCVVCVVRVVYMHMCVLVCCMHVCVCVSHASRSSKPLLHQGG